MKRYLIYFLLAMASYSFLPPSLGVSNVSAVEYPQAKIALTKPQIDSVQAVLPLFIPSKELPASTTAEDIVQWLLNALGSFLTTIIMYFLHRWFPKIFSSAKIKAYKRPPL